MDERDGTGALLMDENLNKVIQYLNLKNLNVTHYLIGVISGAGLCFVCYKTWKWVRTLRQSTNDLGDQSQRVTSAPQHQLLLSPSPAMLETNTGSRLDLRHVTVRRGRPEARGREEADGLGSATGPDMTPTELEEMYFAENQKQVKDERERHSEDLLNLLYNIGEDQAKKDSIVHRGISCNICHSNPLTGIRYKCVNCVDYDVCSSCQPACDHDITHMFLKVVIPIPPLANPRSALMPAFYPGK